MVESYQPGIVPEFCFDWLSTSPTVFISVRATNPDRNIFNDVYEDIGIKPIFVQAGTYK